MTVSDLKRSSHRANGYHMIHSIHIKNFRGIRDLVVNDAKRINVLVGPNGTGKTAFLEAIFAAAGGSPEVLMRTLQWRGRTIDILAGTDQIFDAVWADTFNNPDLGSASVHLSGDENETRSVEICKSEFQNVLNLDGQQREGSLGLQFIYDSPNLDKPKVIEPKIVGNQVRSDAVPSKVRVHFLAARTNVSEEETAKIYSQLRISDRAAKFEKAFLEEFPFLKGLSVEAPWGPAAVYGHLTAERKLPLTLISSGINQLASMLVRLSANPRCVLLIDEIENGFYYDRYESIWRTLYDLSLDVEGQIFATTHSFECLKALSQALQNHADEVCFLRTRLKDNEVQVERKTGETMFRAIEYGEIR